ncbi:chemotaxis response regulator protein-glutamate methylesterase [Virgibacillus indicus]|uniref:Protein-glutamate methylesterase/protein-glutamine glutaminase n=1 Tax=Virgibacillus indicus TaxID=2024554 RepID=A0A265NE40_9BACI|nr:chemotaxis response regulator protein-glutamate methylesterase [Virgibacillus indicus]OZU90302.1 chemotaxis response regulator protein-glutamate methylesterase [Virgibacillus indicus]
MNPIRVIVIDDSAFMRKILRDILTGDHRIEVVATARNGEEGLKKIKELKPDVATLDVHMPVMDGITALKAIMKDHPLPVVMLSSISTEGTTKTVQAISNGAVDFITKPSGPISLDITTIRQEIITKVITAAKVNIKKCAEKEKTVTAANNISAVQPFSKTIIAIGTSTGGPRALQRVLADLGNDIAAPILIVQHMPKGFTKSLAERLNAMCSLNVREAVHGEILKDNTAYIAPGDFHMKVRDAGTSAVIELNKEPPLHGHRPAVDILFEAVGNLRKVNKIAVILTGMGSDGSKGIEIMREMDPEAKVIAEAEETSIIYGMPKAALKTNCVNYVVPLDRVGKTLLSLAKQKGGK